MSRNGSWERRNYEVPDARLVQAERQIFRVFGDKVSIEDAAESVIKFGKSDALSLGSLETVWTVGGNETYLTSNLIDTVSSSNTGDTQDIELQGSIISGSGVNTVLTPFSQTVTLDGQNKVPLATPLARTNRMYNDGSVELLGRVLAYEDTAITGGIPTDVSKIHIDIPIGLQQSFKCATTIDDQTYLIYTGSFGSISLRQSAVVDYYLEVRNPGGVFRQQTAISSSSTSGPWQINQDPCLIIPPNSDIRFRVETGTNAAIAFAHFKGYVAKVIG